MSSSCHLASRLELLHGQLQQLLPTLHRPLQVQLMPPHGAHEAREGLGGRRDRRLRGRLRRQQQPLAVAARSGLRQLLAPRGDPTNLAWDTFKII